MKKMAAVALMLFLAGCAGDGSEIPMPGAPECTGVEARFTCIQEFVLTPNCAISGCHDAGTGSNGLVLEDGFAYTSLLGSPPTGQPSTWNASLLRVEPGNPDDSFLVIKLEGSDPRMAGSPMPLGGSRLSNEEIQAIRDWIANGAQDD